MSTLAEIESAMESLTLEEQESLQRRLDEKLTLSRRNRLWSATGWPIPLPDVPMEELKRIHALIEKEFSRVDS